MHGASYGAVGARTSNTAHGLRLLVHSPGKEPQSSHSSGTASTQNSARASAGCVRCPAVREAMLAECPRPLFHLCPAPTPQGIAIAALAGPRPRANWQGTVLDMCSAHAMATVDNGATANARRWLGRLGQHGMRCMHADGIQKDNGVIRVNRQGRETHVQQDQECEAGVTAMHGSCQVTCMHAK